MKTNEILHKVVESSLSVEKAVLDEKYAFFSSDPAASRRTMERESRGYYRTPFAHDVDRIMHCHSYARYMDKTQVFFQIKNDHISRRSLHLRHFPSSYRDEAPTARIVADYLSLMTDQYFLKQYEREFMPRQIDYD